MTRRHVRMAKTPYGELTKLAVTLPLTLTVIFVYCSVEDKVLLLMLQLEKA